MRNPAIVFENKYQHISLIPKLTSVEGHMIIFSGHIDCLQQHQQQHGTPAADTISDNNNNMKIQKQKQKYVANTTSRLGSTRLDSTQVGLYE